MKQQQQKVWVSYACICFPTLIGAETAMRDRTTRVLVVVIVVSILALIGTGVGMAAVLRTYGVAASPPPVAQATPALGVTHVFIRNYAYQPAAIEVVWGTAVAWTNQDSAVIASCYHTSSTQKPISGRVARSARAVHFAIPSWRGEHSSTTALSTPPWLE